MGRSQSRKSEDIASLGGVIWQEEPISDEEGVFMYEKEATSQDHIRTYHKTRDMERYVEEMDEVGMRMMAINIPVSHPTHLQTQKRDLQQKRTETPPNSLPMIVEEQENESLSSLLMQESGFSKKRNGRVQFGDDTDMQNDNVEVNAFFLLPKKRALTCDGNE